MSRHAIPSAAQADCSRKRNAQCTETVCSVGHHPTPSPAPGSGSLCIAAPHHPCPLGTSTMPSRFSRRGAPTLGASPRREAPRAIPITDRMRLLRERRGFSSEKWRFSPSILPMQPRHGTPPVPPVGPLGSKVKAVQSAEQESSTVQCSALARSAVQCSASGRPRECSCMARAVLAGSAEMQGGAAALPGVPSCWPSRGHLAWPCLVMPGHCLAWPGLAWRRAAREWDTRSEDCVRPPTHPRPSAFAGLAPPARHAQ
jgi:hypothetical protein